MTEREAIEILSRPFSMQEVPKEILDAHRLAISALEKQEQTNAQSVNSMRTSRPNALKSLNILEQAKDDKGCVPMSLVRQAFRNVIEQAVDKSCKTCKHRKLSAWEKPCNRCYFASGVLKDGYEPYTEEES